VLSQSKGESDFVSMPDGVETGLAQSLEAAASRLRGVVISDHLNKLACLNSLIKSQFSGLVVWVSGRFGKSDRQDFYRRVARTPLNHQLGLITKVI